MDYIFVLVGLVLLFIGGEALVRGSVGIAERFKLSKLLIGMAIVGFGTSTPEMLVSVKAAMDGFPEISIGNVVGSNIANVILILGIGAVMLPLAAHDRAVKRDTLTMVAATVFLWAVALAFGHLMSWVGAAMVISLLAYIVWAYKSERCAQALAASSANNSGEDDLPEGVHSPLMASIAIIIGLMMLVFGADYLVTGAVSIARDLGLSEAFIGLTLVAVGTSLPELVTTVISAYKKHGDMVLGNIIGSNIFNILAILGVTAVINPIDIADQFTFQDIPVALGIALWVAVLVFARGRISRRSGIAFLVAYAAYTGYLLSLQG